MTERRKFLKNMTIATVGISLISSSGLLASRNISPPFVLPPLSFSPDALEPFIDKLTMEIHHGKHHKAYIDNLNKAISANELYKDKNIEYFFSITDKLPLAVRNNAGGHYNHSLFWDLLSPPKNQQPGKRFTELVNSNFGNIENFKEEFKQASMQRFGSGWAWAVIKDNKLVICTTPNQDNPLMNIAEQQGKPILALDVWEHAYYLKYQNLRADYIKAFWNVVNWNKVEMLIGN